MKINKKLVALSATFAIAAQFDTIAMADAALGTVDATVVTPLKIIQATPMNFGTVAGGTTPGTIIMTATGSRSATGDAQFIGTDGQEGVFTITGVTDASISVSATDTTATLESITGTGTDMPFTLTEPTYPTTITGGSVDVSFGGTLSIGADQSAGSYSTAVDTFSIKVDYN